MSWYGASGRNRNKIYVGNLSSRTKEEDIRSEFSKYGDVVDVIMKYDFAFVEMEDDRSMDNAIDRLDRCEIDGRRWKVEPARRSRPPRRDMGGRGPPRGGLVRRRAGMRPTRGEYRIEISGLSSGTSWQDLKDWARQAGDSVVYGDVFVEKGKRMGIIEYDRRDDFEHALKYLDKDKLHGKVVSVRKEGGFHSGSESSRSRSRSRSRRRDRSKDKRKHRSSKRSRSRGERGRSDSGSSRSRSRSYSRSRSRSRKRGSPTRASRNYHSSASRSSSPATHSKSPNPTSPKPPAEEKEQPQPAAVETDTAETSETVQPDVASPTEESAPVEAEPPAEPEPAVEPKAEAEAEAQAEAEADGAMDVDEK